MRKPKGFSSLRRCLWEQGRLYAHPHVRPKRVCLKASFKALCVVGFNCPHPNSSETWGMRRSEQPRSKNILPLSSGRLFFQLVPTWSPALTSLNLFGFAWILITPPRAASAEGLISKWIKIDKQVKWWHRWLTSPEFQDTLSHSPQGNNQSSICNYLFLRHIIIDTIN